eukprot:4265837-Pleurochrysis_carterae.AAC.1
MSTGCNGSGEWARRRQAGRSLWQGGAGASMFLAIRSKLRVQHDSNASFEEEPLWAGSGITR